MSSGNIVASGSEKDDERQSQQEDKKDPCNNPCPTKSHDKHATATSPKEPTNPDSGGPAYPTGLKLAIIIIGLELAILCVAMDNTIIVTAIPHITNDFHALSDVGWYGSAYLLPLAAFQLLFGRFYSVFNIKWTFLLTLAVFEIGSLVCATAPNSIALILGRAIAGLGSAGLFNGTLIILAHSTPIEKRPLYTSLVTSVYGIASIVGPLIGGVLTDHTTWRWCFYINLPIGAVTALALLFFLRSIPGTPFNEKSWIGKVSRLDPLGTVIFVPCIVCLLLALQWGGTTYRWSNGRVIALLVVFAVALLAFLAIQVWMKENATIPIRIARQRNIIGSMVFMLCNGAAYFIMVYYVPIWFQAIKGVSATQSGIDILPLMIANVIASIVAGTLVTILGYYTPFTYGLVVIGSIGAGLITTWIPDISSGKQIGSQILFGAGIGLGMQQGFVAAQASLPLADIPVGTSVVMFAQMFGGSVFLSVAQNVFTDRLVEGLEHSTTLDPQAIVNAGATQISSLAHNAAVLSTIQSVYNSALTKAFQVSLIMTCLSAIGALCLEWKSVKKVKSEGESNENQR